MKNIKAEIDDIRKAFFLFMLDTVGKLSGEKTLLQTFACFLFFAKFTC